MTFNKMCRSCMKEIDFINFDESVFEMFTFCTNIRDSEENKLPKNFCYLCISQINSSYKYIKQAHKINKTLRSYIHDNGDIKTNNINTFNIESKFNWKSDNYCGNTSLEGFENIKLSSDDLNNYNAINLETDTEPVEPMLSKIANLTNYETGQETQNDQNANDFLNEMTQGLIDDLNDNIEEFDNVNETHQTTQLKQLCQDQIVHTLKEGNLILADNINPMNVKTKNNEEVTRKPNKYGSYERYDNSCSPIQVAKSLKQQLKHHSSEKLNTDDIKCEDQRDDGKAEASTTDVKGWKGCPKCQKRFTSQVWLTRHVAKKHSVSQGHQCPVCAKSFETVHQMRSHKRAHLEEDKKHACNTCGKRFWLHKHLAVHMLSHSDKRPFICDICHLTFKMKHVLINHMRVHENGKPSLCYICGKSFTTAFNLNSHMVVHTGEKPFACKHCHFRAGFGSVLRRHELKKHTSTRRYACVHCQKSFYDGSALARHTLVHTGERPYKCPLCARGFTDSWKRKTHLMRFHQFTLEEIPKLARDGRPSIH